MSTTTRNEAPEIAIRNFIDTHYRHFNAAALRDAARAYCKHLDENGAMFVTLAGAMSTAELGISLAEMIRRDKVHAICCTGANLEEDVFNAIAHDHYRRIPHYRDLTPKDEAKLLDGHLNRVTDTCIPEGEAMRKIDNCLIKLWDEAHRAKQRYFPHEYFYRLVLSKEILDQFQVPREHSWLLAAAEKNLPLFVPGWEDSTMGNSFVSEHFMKGFSLHCIKSGLEYMKEMVTWYKGASAKREIGFFQIGGGIAGDFPICAVPLIRQDLGEDVPLWSYFCQITDAQESYGGYSGALPNEKITWEKLDVDTPKFVIHSDATIVAPLIFAYVLEG